MSKHTSGPWQVVKDGKYIKVRQAGSLPIEVCTVYGLDNAALIAAAPDMKALLDELYFTTEELSDKTRKRIDRVRAMAEGR